MNQRRESPPRTNRLYTSYREFMDRTRTDMLGILQRPKDREFFQQARRPMTQQQFEKSLVTMSQEQRLEFEERLLQGYDHARQTWGREAGKRLFERLVG